MKKLIASVLTAGATLAAFGQGEILLDNFTSALIPIHLADGVTTAIGNQYKAEVFKSDSTGAFVALVGSATFDPALTGARAGRFNGGKAVVPGVAPNTAATLVVRVWDSTSGDTYDTASVKGKSAPFQSLNLGGIDPSSGNPLTPPKLVGLASFNLAGVPEPSTIALGALGAAALVLRRRK